MKLVCPSCGDNLSYRVKEKDSFCPTCQMSFPIQEQPFDMQAFVCQQCSSCGAEIVSDDETRIVACEYCDGKEFQTVMFENGFHPVGIIPFQISEEEAKSIFYSLIKSAGKELENCVEMVQIQRFYVPYSYEYQFFDSHLNTFQKNLGKMDESDPQRIGNHHIYDPSLGTMKGIPSANHAMWRYYDYSQMLFQIQPFSIKKVKPLNPIYLDYACALNVKQEYVKEIVGSRKPEYYWVPIYKISFKAPPIENNVFFKDELENYVMLINGETKEYGTTYEFLHRKDKTEQAKSLKAYFSKKEMNFESYFMAYIIIAIIVIAVIMFAMFATISFNSYQDSIIGTWLYLGIVAVFLIAMLIHIIKFFLKYIFKNHH